VTADTGEQYAELLASADLPFTIRSPLGADLAAFEAVPV